jgi:hypothetical protein
MGPVKLSGLINMWKNKHYHIKQKLNGNKLWMWLGNKRVQDIILVRYMQDTTFREVALLAFSSAQLLLMLSTPEMTCILHVPQTLDSVQHTWSVKWTGNNWGEGAKRLVKHDQGIDEVSSVQIFSWISREFWVTTVIRWRTFVFRWCTFGFHIRRAKL